MQITITGHHIEVSPALRDHVHEKFDRIENHIDDLLSIDVTLQVEKLDTARHTAKANIHVKGDLLHAESHHDDMYAAINLMVDKLHRQAIKHKEKHQKHADGGKGSLEG